MSAADGHWWLNFATMIGIALLAIPAWSLNFRKKKLQQIKDALPEEPAAFKDRVQSVLKDKRERQVADWRRIDEVCLILGYALVLASSLIRLWVPWP